MRNQRRPPPIDIPILPPRRSSQPVVSESMLANLQAEERGQIGVHINSEEIISKEEFAGDQKGFKKRGGYVQFYNKDCSKKPDLFMDKWKKSMTCKLRCVTWILIHIDYFIVIPGWIIFRIVMNLIAPGPILLDYQHGQPKEKDIRMFICIGFGFLYILMVIFVNLIRMNLRENHARNSRKRKIIHGITTCVYFPVVILFHISWMTFLHYIKSNNFYRPSHGIFLTYMILILIFDVYGAFCFFSPVLIIILVEYAIYGNIYRV